MNQTDKPLVNRVAQSGLITLDLENYFPKGEVVPFDLKPFLFRELILREKDFREQMDQMDWSQYAGKHLAVFCSTDAIIPMWAYMLVAAQAAQVAAGVIQCTPEQYTDLHFLRVLSNLNPSDYTDQRIIVKGCSDHPVPPLAYLEITRMLTPVAKSVMFGEPCSTVPVYNEIGFAFHSDSVNSERNLYNFLDTFTIRHQCPDAASSEAPWNFAEGDTKSRGMSQKSDHGVGFLKFTKENIEIMCSNRQLVKHSRLCAVCS